MATKKTITKATKTSKTLKTAKEKPAGLKIPPKTEEVAKLADKEPPVIEAQEQAKTTGPGTEKYYEAIGRRKEATARVRLYTRKSTDPQIPEDKALITVNDKPYYEYFRASRLQNMVEAPLRKLKSANRFKATVKISGGGSAGQADAIKFGLARSLILFDLNFSKKLRKSGYLTRDSRAKERRKYGLKKARKAPQWSKR